MRLPFFVWAQFVTSFLLLLAFPPLEGAAFLQLMDRVAETSFFLPSGLVVSGQVLAVSGGGNPLLWQHLFWFLAHPEVYVLILPAMGIVAEVIANNTRKPLWGYRSMVYSLIFLGFMSFIVWAHHMFITGMGTTMATFFQTTTMIISIPSVVILTRAVPLALRRLDPLHHPDAVRARPSCRCSASAGSPGCRSGLSATDIHLHDTYYVIGHFHYVVAPGTIFALFAGIYYWFPKVTGRLMNETLGRIHFCGLVPVHERDLHADVHHGAGGRLAPALRRRRLLRPRAAGAAAGTWSRPGAPGRLALFQIPFIINFFWSIWRGKKTRRESVARHDARVGGALAAAARQLRDAARGATAGPTSTACPGAPRDYSPQWEAAKA